MIQRLSIIHYQINIYIYLLSWNPQKMCACFFVCCLRPEDGALLSASQFSESKGQRGRDHRKRQQAPTKALYWEKGLGSGQNTSVI